uniref:Uncharacterized protein n=1 Tax=Mimivirus LCMiAC01 TaxID=2506608 RepID=A0A481Z0S8_9VIRU|nr:MAG: hypothetical protein LCMiAC01_04530 [Mimivirus LCMiAC01]
MDKFDATIDSWLQPINKNKYITAAISLILIVYAGLAAPKLPRWIARLFDNPLVKLLIFFLIVYTAGHNPTISIIAAIGLMVTLQTLSKYKFESKVKGLVSRIDSRYSEAKAKLFGEKMGNVEMPIMRQQLGQLNDRKQDPTACTKVAKFRDDFYPQYVNMKPDAYMARYTGDTVSGYDESADYAEYQS